MKRLTRHMARIPFEGGVRGEGGGRETHVLCGAAHFSQKFTLRCAKKTNFPTHY